MAFKPDNELEEVFIIEDFDYHPVCDAIEDEYGLGKVLFFFGEG